MITFDQGKAKFTYRVVGIVMDNQRVLLHRAEPDDFWSLPGGRGELLEVSQNTLKREMREELGVEIQVERLLWVVENFFEHNAQSHHELGLYFLMSFPSRSPLYTESKAFAGDEQGLKLIFKWHPLDALEDVLLYPAFLRQALTSIPEFTEHIVHTDSQEQIAK